MTSGKSNYLSDAILSHIFGKGALGVPTIYVGLFTATLTAASDGTSGEVANLYGYARVETAAADWSAVSDQAINNVNPIQFPQADGGGWGTVTHFALLSSGAHGAVEILYRGELDADRQILDGDTPIFAAGTLVATES